MKESVIENFIDYCDDMMIAEEGFFLSFKNGLIKMINDIITLPNVAAKLFQNSGFFMTDGSFLKICSGDGSTKTEFIFIARSCHKINKKRMEHKYAVIFVADIEQSPLLTLGPKMEHNSEFPDGVNCEFVQVLNESTLRMRVWERGSGVTMACGTGACATVAAAIKNGFCSFDDDVSVILDGGTLKIKISSDYAVTMTGPAEFIYEGECEE